MKRFYISSLLFTILFISSALSFAQPNTDVFLFDLEEKNDVFSISNQLNISNNEGYDNQPSFLDANTILFASTRNGQTDILKYSISDGKKTWINQSEGSEYSPLKIPNSNYVTAIQLDKDGTQTLNRYHLKNGKERELISDIIIGYQVWSDKNTLVSSVLDGEGLSLTVSNIKTGKHNTIQSNIGRSLHNIPKTNLVSYISKTNDVWEIRSLNVKTGKTKHIINTIKEAEDMCWTPNGTILMGKQDHIYKFNPKQDKNWVKTTSIRGFNIKNISRLAVNPNSNQLALVAENGKSETSEKLVQTQSNKQLEPKLKNIAWISGTWHGEAFGGITEEIWSEPSGGSMMATFKLINDDKVTFYEIEIIREINNTLILQLKHFNNDLKGWETKDETVDFPLKKITTNKVVFEGMTFEKITNTEMNIFVDIKNDDGKIEVVKFNYKKK